MKILTFPSGSYQCNTTIIYCDEKKTGIIIDPGNDDQLVIKKIAELNITITDLIHTHAHFDHIGASSNIQKKCGGKMCLHRQDLQLYQSLKTQGQFFRQPVGEIVPIDHYLEDQEIFQGHLKTIHTPGHTPGSCSFYTEVNQTPILFSGDTLFNQSVGRTDFPGGDFQVLKKSIKDRLFSLPSETLVIAGHGPNTMIGHEIKMNPFLQ